MDLYNSTKALQLLAPADRATSANGAGVDVRPYDGRATAVLQVGTCTGDGVYDDQTYDVKLQESDDNSTWSDISGASFTQYTDASTATVEEIAVPLRTGKRYVRAVFTYGGTAGGTFPSACVLTVGEAQYLPI